MKVILEDGTTGSLDSYGCFGFIPNEASVAEASEPQHRGTQGGERGAVVSGRRVLLQSILLHTQSYEGWGGQALDCWSFAALTFQMLGVDAGWRKP